jgi:hypothetical protein
VIRRDEKLRRKVALLGKLSVVQRLLVGFEIGAAVLPVGIEEQRVKAVVEIVVVRCIASRSPARIELPDAAMEVADEPCQPRPPRQTFAALTEYDGEDVGDRALFDDDAAVHIGFTELQRGIEQDATLGC